jgi:hypothetical protein
MSQSASIFVVFVLSISLLLTVVVAEWKESVKLVLGLFYLAAILIVVLSCFATPSRPETPRYKVAFRYNGQYFYTLSQDTALTIKVK